LAARAATLLAELGCDNVHIRVGDGTLGWPAAAPFDRIIVTAGAPSTPPPLLDQLSPNGGRLVIPIGTLEDQRLVAVEQRGGVITEQDLGPVRFVPLLGESGWPEGVELPPDPSPE
jgi:protein-L-isoaspartate(D-aspartate) O-methyltransferase